MLRSMRLRKLLGAGRQGGPRRPPFARRDRGTDASRCSTSSSTSPTPSPNAASDVWGTGKDLYEKAGGVRVRQHINPFKKELQVPTESPNWDEVFEDCTLPLEVDVGCGSGRFLLARAKKGAGAANFCGMDIRHKLIERSNKWAKILGADKNVYYLSTNATVSFESVLRDYPGDVTFVSVQYPDPHFKRRHHKRRIVQDDLVTQVDRILCPGGYVFLQSDVREVLTDMRSRFEESPAFVLATADQVSDFAARNQVESPPRVSIFDSESGSITFNPTGVPTEREVHASAEGERMHRSLFMKEIAS